VGNRENRVLLVGFAKALAVSACEHFGSLNFNFEGRAYDFPTTNVTIQARSTFVVGWKLKLVSWKYESRGFMERPSNLQLRKLVGIGNYQFGLGMGSVLFNKSVLIECSRKTGRIRRIYHRNVLVATLRPKDGYLALTPNGASIILSKSRDSLNLVVVQSDVSNAIETGGDIFAKHVVRANPELRPGDEVMVTDEEGLLLGVGAAVLSGRDMCAFKRGVAVKLRKGVKEDEDDDSET